MPATNPFSPISTILRRHYQEPPKDWQKVIASHEYQDGGKAFAELNDTAPQEWHFRYKFNTRDAQQLSDMELFDNHFEEVRYSNSFPFIAKNGLEYSKVFYKEGSYNAHHQGHKSWIQFREFTVIRYPGDGTVSLGAPNQLSPSNIGITSLTLNWDASTAPPGSSIDGYEYRVDGGAWIDAGNVLTVEITGLAEGTEYDFEIRSYDDSDPVQFSSPSNTRTVTTATRSYLLDEITTNVICALSVFKLRGAYTGPCMRVKRESDDTEKDIGFDADGVLDVSDSHFDGSSWFQIVKWYNQADDPNASDWDLIPSGADSANKPRVEEGETPPRVDWQTVGRLKLITPVSVDLQYFQICAVVKKNSTSNARLFTHSSNTFSNGSDLHIDWTNGNSVEFQNGYVLGVMQQMTVISQSGNDPVFKDGSEIVATGGADNVGDTLRSGVFHLGGHSSTSTHAGFRGEIDEFILMEIGERATVEADQKSRFAI